MSLNKQIDVHPITVVNWCAVDNTKYYDNSFWDRYIFTGRVALVGSWKSRRAWFFAEYVPTKLRRFGNVTV